MLLQEAEVWQQLRERNQSASRRFEHGLVFFPLFFCVFVSVAEEVPEGVEEAGQGFRFHHISWTNSRKQKRCGPFSARELRRE